MLDPIELIIAYPDLSAEETAELRRAVAADPALAALFACRREIATAIRTEIAGAAPADPRLFSLFSLCRAGRAAELTAEELELVADHATRLEGALMRHQALTIASDDVGDAAAEFLDLWDAYFETETGEQGRDVEQAHRTPTDREASRGDERRHFAGRRAATVTVGRAAAPPRRRRAYRWAVRSAIAVALVAFAFIVTQVAERDGGMLTVETGDGEIRLVALGQGSQIRLLESSTLSYADPKSSLNRRAELTGRAYFEIAPEGRGFLVETPTARVTVLGTSFGVDARDRLTEVVLADGRLTLARSEKLDDLVVLEGGQMSRVVAGSGPSPPISIDIPRRLTWTGLFIFHSTPLGDIARLLSDHFGTSIILEDELTDERITGTFEQNQPLEDILDVIASAIGATVEKNAGGGYVLTHP